MKQRKMMYVAMGLILIAVLTSCASAPQHQPPPQPRPTAPPPDERIVDGRVQGIIIPPIIVRPITADLSVGATKVTGNAQAPTRHANLEQLRRIAILDALERASADILLEPTFDTTISHDHGNVEGITRVRVTGFPGNYRNFRSSSDNDITWMQNQLNRNQP
jgi:hypothetical protein